METKQTTKTTTTIKKETMSVVENKSTKPKPTKPKQPTDKKTIIQWVCMSIALLFWTLSFLRVPFIGTFLDSVLFEFLFGFAKYPMYALLMIYILCIKLEKLRKIFCNKKRVAWYFTPILILIIILNTVDCYQKGYDVLKARELYLGENGYITLWTQHYWESTVISFNGDYAFTWLPQDYAFGGIIGLVIVFTISYFSPILLIILLIILFVIFGLIFFSKKYKNKKVKDVVGNIFKEDEIKDKKTKSKDNSTINTNA